MFISTRPLVRLDASEGELRFAGKDIRQSTGPHKRKQVFRLKKEDGVNSVQPDEWCDLSLAIHSPIEKIRPGGRPGRRRKASGSGEPVSPTVY